MPGLYFDHHNMQGGHMAVKPIPEGMNTVTPYLCVKGAAAAIDFYCNA